MKKSIVKAISVFMALVMLLCALPFAVGAENGKTLTESGYTYTVVDGEATIIACDDSISGDITIPDTLGGYPVVSVGYQAFLNNSKITSIVNPASLRSIEDEAFQNCTVLESIIIPEGVTNIGAGAFASCNSLKSVTMPKSITSISNTLFFNCKALNSVIIKGNLTEIGDAAFSFCTNLKDITIPNSVTEIGKGAFCYCSGLSNFDFPDGLITIEQNSFSGCTGLTSVTLPDGLENIEQAAFHSCESLLNIEIPDSVISVGVDSFANTAWYNAQDDGDVYAGKVYYKYKGTMPENTGIIIKEGTKAIAHEAFNCEYNLTNIVIPDSVTYVGDKAFLYTKWYESLEDGEIYIGKTFYEYKGSMPENTAIVLKNGTKRISSHAFDACTELTNITLPESLIEIGDNAFSACFGLTSILIPRNVKEIGDDAFASCSDNFTIIGYTGTVAEAYAKDNGFEFIALPDEHTHTFGDWVVTKEATCEEDGEETITCSECGETQTRAIESFGHEFFHVQEDSTCTVAGVSYDICTRCKGRFNYIVLPIAPHEFGEWSITKNATVVENGERVRVCGNCGFTETETTEKLPATEAKDEKTGISVVCPEGSYEGDIEVTVKETFDGSSYHVLNTEKGNCQKTLYDITTTVEGEKVQPNGSVWVKIPLPAGYDPKNTTVYYVTNDGKLEEMESKIIGGYIVFETTHFSYYAVVEEKEPSQPDNPSVNCKCNCHKKGIANFFFKIILIFQKIFKKNKLCSCGVAHY